MSSTNERFGFRFWLMWIVSFAGSFLASAVIWTFVITSLIGPLREPELLLSWAVAVFGSWFLILTPFMRKKEQIWKRLNHDEEKAVNVWLAGMGFFIGLLAVSSIAWSYVHKAIILGDGALSSRWMRDVAATWLILALPFLVFLYKKADKIFKDAVSRQSAHGPRFRTVFVEKSRRMLPETLAEKIRQFPETLQRGHVLTLTLKDRQKIPHVFILDAKEILGVYDRAEADFEAADVLDAELASALPDYEEAKWLRLDGRAG